MIDDYINRIITGDCLELLKEIPDESVDMTFADPPFNLKKKYTNYNDSLEFKEYLDWCDEWISEMVRVTKPTGSRFVHNIPKWFYVKDIKQAKIYELRMPHERERKSSYLRKDYGGKKAGIHPYGPLVSDVWTDIHRIKHNKYRDEHPCQLPIHLLERLILMVTDEGDIVLDPFMGTGTTAIAAKKLGRKYIGFDLNEEYKIICENKLKKVDSDARVGESWVSFYLKEVRTIRNKDWDDLSDYFEIPENRKDLDFIKIKLK